MIEYYVNSDLAEAVVEIDWFPDHRGWDLTMMRNKLRGRVQGGRLSVGGWVHTFLSISLRHRVFIPSCVIDSPCTAERQMDRSVLVARGQGRRDERRGRRDKVLEFSSAVRLLPKERPRRSHASGGYNGRRTESETLTGADTCHINSIPIPSGHYFKNFPSSGHGVWQYMG